MQAASETQEMITALKKGANAKINPQVQQKCKDTVASMWDNYIANINNKGFSSNDLRYLNTQADKPDVKPILEKLDKKQPLSKQDILVLSKEMPIPKLRTALQLEKLENKIEALSNAKPKSWSARKASEFAAGIKKMAMASIVVLGATVGIAIGAGFASSAFVTVSTLGAGAPLAPFAGALAAGMTLLAGLPIAIGVGYNNYRQGRDAEREKSTQSIVDDIASIVKKLPNEVKNGVKIEAKQASNKEAERQTLRGTGQGMTKSFSQNQSQLATSRLVAKQSTDPQPLSSQEDTAKATTINKP